MPLGTDVGPGLRNIVLDGTQLSLPKGVQLPLFSSCLLYSQTAGWMKTPLGTEVEDLGSGHIVLHGVTALCERGAAAPPIFGPCLLWPRWLISATAELLFSNCRYMP